MRLNINMFLIIFLFIASSAGAESLPMPINYPDGVVGDTKPYIIWFDKNSERDLAGIKFRISLNADTGRSIDPVIVKPSLYQNYYFFRFPFALEQDNYNYTIDRLVDSGKENTKYYHSLKYPVKGSFTIDPSVKNPEESLPPDRLIEYLKSEKGNTLQNGYNAIFYGSAAIGSFGIGMLFYSVIDLGIISKIIYTAAFISSGAGLGASGYYGYNYFIERNQTQKIVDIAGVSLNAGVSQTMICADLKLSF
jgi:hypothetical protein